MGICGNNLGWGETRSGPPSEPQGDKEFFTRGVEVEVEVEVGGRRLLIATARQNTAS